MDKDGVTAEPRAWLAAALREPRVWLRASPRSNPLGFAPWDTTGTGEGGPMWGLRPAFAGAAPSNRARG